MRPWSNGAKKVYLNYNIVKLLILLRMCLRVKKILFACSFGMQALVYLSASNFEKVFLFFQ